MNLPVFITQQNQEIEAHKSDLCIDPNTPVSWVKSKNEMIIVSRYSDDIWDLNPFSKVGNIKATQRKMDFGTLPTWSQSSVKFGLLRFMINGIEGKSKPTAGTLCQAFLYTRDFINYLDSKGIDRLSECTPFIAIQYSHFLNQQVAKSGKNQGQPLSLGNKTSKLLAVERIQEMLADTSSSFPKPWPESSAYALAEVKTPDLANENTDESGTKCIPDDILNSILTKSEEVLSGASKLFKYRDIRNQFNTTSAGGNKARLALEKAGWKLGIRELTFALDDVFSAASLVIGLTTGMRNQEMNALKADATNSELGGENSWETDEDGNVLTYHYLRSESTKTKAGYVEWMCPEIAIKAHKILCKWVEPYQEALKTHIQCETNEVQRVQFKKLLNKVLLAHSQTKNNMVVALTKDAFNKRINKTLNRWGVDWDYASHQNRKTFAVYVAKSQLGDLRYLREHYKHWSLSMTVAYALSEYQDDELYFDVFDEIETQKRAVIEHAFDESVAIAGGTSERIRVLRKKGEMIKLFPSRKEMIDTVAKTTPIRATGTAFCTAGERGCSGGGANKRTKCGGCSESLITEVSHLHKWKAIHSQQMELAAMDDIGPAGKEKALEELEEARVVLRQLGVNVEVLEREISNDNEYSHAG